MIIHLIAYARARAERPRANVIRRRRPHSRRSRLPYDPGEAAMISHATLHWAFVSLFATLAAVSLQPAEAADFVELKREKYQKEIDAKKVDLYTIRNRGGMVEKITNGGAKVQQILVPDRNGVLGDVALGYETIDDLQAGQGSMGAFVGRYANRNSRSTARNTSSRPTTGRTRCTAA